MTKLIYNKKMRLVAAFAVSTLIIFSGLSIGCQAGTSTATPATTQPTTTAVTPGVTTEPTPKPTSSGGSLFNQPPQITSSNVDKEVVTFSGTCRLTCEARDPDRRDTLTFTWSATGGTIDSTTTDTISDATWTAPATVGTYTLTVTVSDGKGGQAVKEFTVSVNSENNYPPYINKLTADPYDPYDDCTSTFTCDASDLEGEALTYIWNPSDGSIKGDGPVVTWVPPLVPGAMLECTITVQVRDSAGNISGRKWLHVTSVCDCLRPHGSTPETACAPSQEPGYKPPGSAPSSGQTE